MDDVEIPGGPRFDHHVLRFPRVSVGAVVVDPDRVLLLWRHRFTTNRWGAGRGRGRPDFSLQRHSRGLSSSRWMRCPTTHLWWPPRGWARRPSGSRNRPVATNTAATSFLARDVVQSGCRYRCCEVLRGAVFLCGERRTQPPHRVCALHRTYLLGADECGLCVSHSDRAFVRLQVCDCQGSSLLHG